MTAKEAKTLADKYKAPDLNAKRRKYFLEEIERNANYGYYSYTVESADFTEDEAVEFEKLGYKVKRMVHRILIPSGLDVSDLIKGHYIGAFYYDGEKYHKVEHIYEFAVISWGE